MLSNYAPFFLEKKKKKKRTEGGSSSSEEDRCMRVLVKTFWPAFCLIHPGLKLWKTFFSFGERNQRAQSKNRDSTTEWRIDVAFSSGCTSRRHFGVVARHPSGGELPFLKGFSLWTDQSERVYFYWPPGPNPVVTISTRVGPGSRLCVPPADLPVWTSAWADLDRNKNWRPHHPPLCYTRYHLHGQRSPF